MAVPLADNFRDQREGSRSLPPEEPHLLESQTDRIFSTHSSD